MIIQGRLRVYRIRRYDKRRGRRTGHWRQAFVLLPSDKDTIKQLVKYDKKEVLVVIDEESMDNRLKLKTRVERYAMALRILDELLAEIPEEKLETFIKERPQNVKLLIEVLEEIKTKKSPS